MTSIFGNKAAVAEPTEPWGAAEKRRLNAELERLDAEALQAAADVSSAAYRARVRQTEILQKRSDALGALAALKAQCPELFQ